MKKYLFLLLTGAAPFLAKAQSGDFSALIKSGPADATKLSRAYLTPMFKGLGVGLNSGWNTTAAAKGLGGFDVRFGGTIALAPSADKTFNIGTLGLSSNLRAASNSSATTPTVFGSGSGSQLVVTDNNGREVERFTLPGGSGISFAPAPEVQASVGLVFNTEISARFTPRINFGDDFGRVSSWGIGFKHDLIQHFVGGTAEKLVPFNLAVAFAFSRLNYDLDLDVPPPSNAQPANSQQSTDFSNQKIEGHLNGVNVELILSKKLLAFTPFLSVGWNSARTNVGLKGNYPIITGANLTGQRFYTTFTDPVSIKETAYSGFRGNLGFQVQAAFFRLFASYSIAEYQAVNAGIGFGFGK
ncbi:MAG: hypothetical protein INR69_17885 [Mucilaginibacter polytrichastri]|nr:hypothetical protein [Mucilaginibacter polytrichastri]